MAAGQKKKSTSQGASRFYEAKGNGISRKNKSCPKCGPGYFLAEHKNRISCGKCHYTEMKK